MITMMFMMIRMDGTLMMMRIIAMVITRMLTMMIMRRMDVSKNGAKTGLTRLDPQEFNKQMELTHRSFTFLTSEITRLDPPQDTFLTSEMLLTNFCYLVTFLMGP